MMHRGIWVLMMVSGLSHAAGFSLYTEGSAVAVGNFAAGVAAEAADASTGWYNPAGLVLLDPTRDQILLSGVGVLPNTTLSGFSRYNTTDVPSYVQSFDRLHGSQEVVVPAVHYVHPLHDRIFVGFSLVSPFGSSTHWDDLAPTRYAATLTKIVTVNGSPEMGVLLTDHLSFGLGLDLQWSSVKFDGVAGSPAALAYLESYGVPVTPTSFDSSSINQGTSFGVGFHAGLLSFFNQKHTRIGLNYQSGVAHDYTGSSTLTGRLADPSLTDPAAVFTTNSLMSNPVQLPEIVTLSLYQDVAQQWAVLGSVVYTAWNVFKTTELNNVAGYSVESDSPALMQLVTPQNFNNTWRFAGGLNYHVNPRWMMRGGAGYDQTPTNNATRDIRLPDANRWALAIGTHVQVTKALAFDAGYSYLFATGASPVNNTQVFDLLSSVNVQAQAWNKAQLAALQMTWNFDVQEA